MANHIMDKFKYGSDIYVLQDNVSGYTTNTGTITEVKTNAGAHTAIDVTSGIAEFNVPTTYSDVGAAASSHLHGNITNGGDITATAPTIANGDQLIINDNSESKITNGPTFDGSTTSKALTPKGTWESFSTSDTTYSISGSLASHKFSTTLNPSLGTTSTSAIEFAAGTGITLTDDTTNKKITIASSVTNTDEKVNVTSATLNSTYNYPVLTLSSETTATTKRYSAGLKISYDNTNGYILDIGTNSSAKGEIRLGNSSSSWTTIVTSATAAKTITLPNATGTIALTSDIPTNVSAFTNDAGYITGYTETDPVFSASVASGITSSDISNWNSKTSNVGTVTSVGISNATNGGLSVSGSPVTSSGTITVGHSNVLTSAQTTQAVYPIKIDKNGHISAYGTAVTIPTNTSDLTNDSGFVTSDTKNTAGASNSTSTLYLVGATDQQDYSQTYTNSFLSYNNGLYSESSLNGAGQVGTYISQDGSTGSVSIGSYGGSVSGNITIDSTGTSITGLVTPTNNTDAATKKYVDDSIPTVPSITLNGSSTTSPSFYAPTSVGTSNYYLKSSGSGAPSWQAPSDSTSNSAISTGTALVTERDVYYGLVTVNGSSQTRATGIYAPTSAGTDGYYLKSNGSNTAPTWTNFPTIPSITLNGNSTASPSFYAPTSAGTSGYYLKSTGSGAPEWAAISAGGVSDVTVAGNSVVINNVAAIAAPVQIVRW